MRWHILEAVAGACGAEITARATIPGDSPWFSGHFPGDPVLPGVAQVSLAAEVLSRAAGKRMGVRGLRRVRFKRIIRPGDILEIRLTPDPKLRDAYGFRILTGDDIAASGLLLTEGPEENPLQEHEP